MDQVITLVVGFVTGPARAYVDAERLHRTTTETDEEWWARNAPILEQIMDPSRYPISGRVGQAAGEEYGAPGDPERAFQFGLARVIDGIEVYVGPWVEEARSAVETHCQGYGFRDAAAPLLNPRERHSVGGLMSAPNAIPTASPAGEPQPEARPEADADSDDSAHDEPHDELLAPGGGRRFGGHAPDPSRDPRGQAARGRYSRTWATSNTNGCDDVSRGASVGSS